MHENDLKPAISFKVMKKSAITLRDFQKYYFSFHVRCPREITMRQKPGIIRLFNKIGMGYYYLIGKNLAGDYQKINDLFFEFFPKLVYTEAFIYQIDEENEMGKVELAEEHMAILLDFLKRHELYDDKIAEEFEIAKKYYELETAMCSGKPFTEDDIFQANRYKCYDFRVMHRLLFKHLGKPYNEQLMEFFWHIEAYSDIDDDIRQYEDDVERNVYNTYRMLVRLYGKEGKKRLIEHRKSLENKAYNALVEMPFAVQKQFILMEKEYNRQFPSPPIPEPILENEK